jgi:hypothetical protein
MNMLRHSTAVASLLVFAIALGAEPKQYAYVGEIPAVCPITITKATDRLPLGFQISPEEAVKLASERASVRCNDIFQQLVYADSRNYYIIKSLLGPMSEDAYAIVIDGRSGKVSIRNQPK